MSKEDEQFRAGPKAKFVIPVLAVAFLILVAVILVGM